MFAGATLPTKFTRSSVPSEDAGKEVKDDADAVLKMLNAERAAEGGKALTRDAALDKLAKTHSDEMAKAKMVGHDVGTGDPAARIKAAGVKAKVAGENVATAASPQNAHRALWSSPSHRTQMLSGDFSRVSIAVVKDTDGRVWVTQLFAGEARRFERAAYSGQGVSTDGWHFPEAQLFDRHCCAKLHDWPSAMRATHTFFDESQYAVDRQSTSLHDAPAAAIATHTFFALSHVASRPQSQPPSHAAPSALVALQVPVPKSQVAPALTSHR